MIEVGKSCLIFFRVSLFLFNVGFEDGFNLK